MFICPSCKVGYDSGEAFCPEDGSRLVSQSQLIVNPISNDPMVGTVLAGRYEIIKPIGSGGMGVVYEALHTTLGRRFAVKVLREQVSRDADVVSRFQREAKSASTIGHENIIEIIDFGMTDSGACFMVMELLTGQDLAGVLAQYGPMSLGRALPILLQCCRALGAAHDKGIVHRDIKPENVFLIDRENDKDFVKIVDFGIAKISDLEAPGAPGRKLTKTGMIFGTPEYMSTEQAYGRPTDARSDIYAIGVITFELLTGHVPFEGQSFMAVISQHMLDKPRRMSEANHKIQVPDELEAIVARTMEKEPDDRFQSMAELHDAFIGFMRRAQLTSAIPSRLADVSFSAPPRPPSGAGIPVESRPTPRRRDPTPGILKLGDEPERPPSIRSNAGWGVFAGLAVLGLSAVVALALVRPDMIGLGSATEVIDAGGVEAVQPINDTLDVGVDVGADAGSQTATTVEQSAVDVRVATQPSGATITIGGAAGCSPSPCTIRLVPGEAAMIEAHRNGRRGRLSYAPTREGGEVVIPLRRAERPAGSMMHMTRRPLELRFPAGWEERRRSMR